MHQAFVTQQITTIKKCMNRMDSKTKTKQQKEEPGIMICWPDGHVE
jgi:hypothetical protein